MTGSIANIHKMSNENKIKAYEKLGFKEKADKLKKEKTKENK